MAKRTYTNIIRGVLLLTLSAAPLISLPQTALADPTCANGKSLNIVAHQDDDLLFMNPDIQHDIDNGRCSETIYLTAGDANRNETAYWQSREAGIEAAYTEMAGQSGSGTTSSVTINGHAATQFTVANRSDITLVFLHLPDGGVDGSAAYHDLQKLWQGDISSVSTVSGATSATYTKQGLIDTLHAQMASYQPDLIRGLDYTHPFDGYDHTDHEASARFARAAHINYTLAHTFKGYMGYPSADMTANVTGTELTNKQNTYFTYDPYDYSPTPGTSKCPSVSNCNDPDLLTWCQRMYVTGTEVRTDSTFETMEGDSGSLSGNSGIIGKAPATITLSDGTIYAFYYDETNGDLRYATASSSTSPSWSFGTVESSGNVGKSPSVAYFNSQIHVFYYDVNNGNLRHAWSSNGTSWSSNTLDGDPGSLGHWDANVGSSSTAVVYGSSLQLFYYDSDNGNLRHAWSSDGSSWSAENLEGDTGSVTGFDANVGQDPTATVYDGHLQLFYYDATHHDLRHTWENAGWHPETLDGNSTTGGRVNEDAGSTPTVAVYGSTLQVFYYDVSSTNLRHAWSDASGWHFENLDGDVGAVLGQAGDIGQTPNVAISGGDMHVFAYDNTGHDLIHYWTTTTQPWQAERLDGAGDDGSAGRVNSDAGSDPVAIPYGSHIHVFYYDTGNTNLRHATL